ncbi:MAG: hypothetical protein H6713_26040 [Myxococcales bacterium]|nr:hypothetical protein [Myxococcales bacterium]
MYRTISPALLIIALVFGCGDSSEGTAASNSASDSQGATTTAGSDASTRTSGDTTAGSTPSGTGGDPTP